MNDSFFNGIWRMDWGLGNPNKTAALIAVAMVAVWILAFAWRKGFWLALAASVPLGGCLVHTISRGGLLAAGFGMVAVILAAPRPWPRARVVASAIAFWAVVGFMLYLGAHQRLGQGIETEDRSISNRLEIWQSVPAMIVNAPEGWGLGNSGRAYMQWYQPVNRFEGYRTLVNSHLTWLVEFGWPLRFAYVCAWALVFWLCWPSKRTRILSVPFGVWLAFGIAATFSSVAESPVIWILPGLALLFAVSYRGFKREWNSMHSLWIPVASTCLILGGIVALGIGKSSVHPDGTRIVIGNGTPKTWIVAGQETIGQIYGRQLRAELSKGEGSGGSERTERSDRMLPIGIVEHVDALPPLAGATLIVAGKLPDNETTKLQSVIGNANSVLLLSPAFFPQEIGFAADQPIRNVKAVFGEFSQSPTVTAWQQHGAVRTVEGAGDYLAAWPEIVAEYLNQKS